MTIVDNSKDVIDAISFFQRAFTIVLALALGEAFKQFVTDKEEKGIQWDRLPSLLTFLFMVFPFFHGMNRYFFLTYLNPVPSTGSYDRYLLFDGIIFITESALFFTMSRSLAGAQWKRFFIALLVLLFVDTSWGLVELSHMPDINYWIGLNILLGAVIGLAKRHFWNTNDTMHPSMLAAGASFITTSVSYYLLWNTYFPALVSK